MYRLLPVIHLLGQLIVLFSLTMVVPLVYSFITNDAALYAYDKAILITVISGLAMTLVSRKGTRELQVRDGFLLVTLAWTVLPAFAALPLLAFLPELSFTDAYFEAVSGLTASGSTILSGLDQMPASINLWRGELVWLGGMGLIVLAVAILPLLGVGGRQLYRAETPGPMKDTKLTPRITETAKGLWLVYTGLSAACVIAYKAAGMSWLDAVIHAFTTMGLGGFSSHDASYGYFDSPAIEAVAILFMLIAGMNFATHFLAWRDKAFRPYRLDPEARMFLLVTLASCLAAALFLWLRGVYSDFPSALRYASFNIVSIATTTGFSNTDYNLWPTFVPLLMLFLSCFTTCSGSTGGGIKMIRAQLLVQQMYREMVKLLHPNAVSPVKIGRVPVPNNIIFAVLAFLFVYVALIVFLTLLLSASGLDVVTAFSAVVACINNTGPGLNEVGPATTYAVLSNFQTWVCTIAMLLGRLELFTLLIVFTPGFWRK